MSLDLTNSYSAVKTSFWSFVQMLIMHLSAFVITVLLTRVLSIEDYGVLSVANTIIMFSVAIFGLGIPGSAARYLAKSSNINGQIRIIFDVIFLSLISSIVFILCLYFFLPIYAEYSNLNVLNEFTLVLILLFVFEHLRALCIKICNALGKMHIAAKQSLLISVSIICSTGYILYVDPRVESVLEMRAVSLFISLLFITNIIFRCRGEIYAGFSAVRKVSYSRILRYGVPVSLTVLSSFLFIQTDIILISMYSKPSNVALYSISAFLLSRLLVVSFSIGMGLGPKFAKYNSASVISNNINALEKGILISFIITIPIFIIIYMTGSEVLSTLFGDKYKEASWILSLMGVYFLMQSVVAVTGPVLDYSGNARKRAMATLTGGLVNIILSIYLMDIMGVKGIVVSTIIGYFVVFIVSVYEVIRITTFKVFINLKLLCLLGVVFPLMLQVMWLLNDVFYADLVGFVSKLAIFIVVYLLIVFVVNIIKKDDVIRLIKKKE